MNICPTLPGAPQFSSAMAGNGAGLMAVSWMPPVDSGNAPVTRYNVYRNHYGRELVYVGNVSVASPQLPPVLESANFGDSGLNLNTTYYYAVSAINAAGEGPRSEMFSGVSGSIRNTQAWYPVYVGSINEIQSLRAIVPERALVHIPDGGKFLWVADHHSVVTTQFVGGPWEYRLAFAKEFVGSGRLEIGVWNSTTKLFAPYGATNFTNGVGAVSSGDLFNSGSIPMTNFNILPGEFVAFNLVNTPDTTGGLKREMVFATGENSYIYTHPDSMALPTPELSSLLLVAIGLGGVVMAVRRRV